MSDFRTAKEQTEIATLSEGEGKGKSTSFGTIACASPDIEGVEGSQVIVVDEEHRFGVKHKEGASQGSSSWHRTEVLTLTRAHSRRTWHLSRPVSAT